MSIKQQIAHLNLFFFIISIHFPCSCMARHVHAPHTQAQFHCLVPYHRIQYPTTILSAACR